jgi:hypothetical protein
VDVSSISFLDKGPEFRKILSGQGVDLIAATDSVEVEEGGRFLQRKSRMVEVVL